jgi:hypothetical protein
MNRIVVPILSLLLLFSCSGKTKVEQPAEKKASPVPAVKKSQPTIDKNTVPVKASATTRPQTQEPAPAPLTAAEIFRKNEISIFKMNAQIQSYRFKYDTLPKNLEEVKKAVKTPPVEAGSGKADIVMTKDGKGGWVYDSESGVFSVNR